MRFALAGLVLFASVVAAPSASAVVDGVPPCVDPISTCVFTGPYAFVCVSSSPSAVPGPDGGAFACGGWVQADHPGCPSPPQKGFDAVMLVTSAAFVRYFGGCHYVDGVKSTQQGLEITLADPTTGNEVAHAQWVQGDDPSGHSCTMVASLAGNDEPVGCPMGVGPAYVLPSLP
jgi:hypothetical protein